MSDEEFVFDQEDVLEDDHDIAAESEQPTYARVRTNLKTKKRKGGSRNRMKKNDSDGEFNIDTYNEDEMSDEFQDDFAFVIQDEDDSMDSDSDDGGSLKINLREEASRGRRRAASRSSGRRTRNSRRNGDGDYLEELDFNDFEEEEEEEEDFIDDEESEEEIDSEEERERKRIQREKTRKKREQSQIQTIIDKILNIGNGDSSKGMTAQGKRKILPKKLVFRPLVPTIRTIQTRQGGEVMIIPDNIEYPSINRLLVEGEWKKIEVDEDESLSNHTSPAKSTKSTKANSQ